VDHLNQFMKGFCDKTEITIFAGNGGDGAVSFHRTRGIPKGGPDGGDGGDGGSIIFNVNKNLNTLAHLDSKKIFKAQPGGKGSQQNKHGKNGEHLVLEVPPGTLIYQAGTNQQVGTRLVLEKGETQAKENIAPTERTKENYFGASHININININKNQHLIADMSNHTITFTAAQGGRGGYGNAHFVSSVRQAPQFAEIGEEGESAELRLELKLMADVAIIGIPSAGKSTLISVISNAKPKIADYPFTTLIPNLGVVTPFPEDKTKSMIVADIPGLIEGAAEGKGLGHEFLRHIERSRLIVHLIDPTQGDPVGNFNKINEELKKFNPELAKRPQIIAINKTDACNEEKVKKLSEQLTKLLQTPISPSSPICPIVNKIHHISSATTQGTKELTTHIYQELQKLPKVEFLQPTNDTETHRLFQPHLEDPKYWSAEELIQPPIELQTQISHLLNQNIHYEEQEQKEQLIHDKEPVLTTKYFQVRGKRIEQIANMTDWNNKEARMRVEDVLRKMGIEKELLKLKADEDDIIIIGLKPMKFRPKR
jgi:GTPase